MIKYLSYPKDHLNIYNVQYYYIAKSICKDKGEIIYFCNFIYKFYLFNNLFNTKLLKTLYLYNNTIKELINIRFNKYVVYLDNYDFNYIFTDRQNEVRKNIIIQTINDLNLKIDGIKLDDDDFEVNNIDFFSSFFNYLHNHSKYNYLDGFTINFNFPLPCKQNTDILNKMLYPEKQLEAITMFLYNYP